MIENTLDNDVFDTNQDSNNKVLLGALYTATLLYLYHNAISMTFFLSLSLGGRAYLSYALIYFLPMGLVVLIGLLFKKQMRIKTHKRMVKIYVVWMCAIFLYFVFYNFYFQEVVQQLMISRPIGLGEDSKLFDFLDHYITPFIYPLTITLVMYLLYSSTRSNQRNQL